MVSARATYEYRPFFCFSSSAVVPCQTCQLVTFHHPTLRTRIRHFPAYLILLSFSRCLTSSRYGSCCRVPSLSYPSYSCHVMLCCTFSSVPQAEQAVVEVVGDETASIHTYAREEKKVSNNDPSNGLLITIVVIVCLLWFTVSVYIHTHSLTRGGAR